MDGVLYIIDQAGRALAQANQQIAQLQARLAELEAARDDPSQPGPQT